MNPGPFGGADSHRTLLLLLPGSSFERGPPDLTARLRPAYDAPLQDHLSVLCSIGDRLKPRPFSGPIISAGDVLRSLWLMAASKPASQLFETLDCLWYS